MKKLALLSFASCLLLVGNLMAQPINTQIGDLVQSPPNVATFQEYSDVPVNLYNGLAQISVPLCTAQDGPLQENIYLSYHHSGYKPAEDASWVGLNWTLNCGGEISRTVLGIPDEGAFGYLNFGDQLNPSDLNQAAELKMGNQIFLPMPWAQVVVVSAVSFSSIIQVQLI